MQYAREQVLVRAQAHLLVFDYQAGAPLHALDMHASITCLASLREDPLVAVGLATGTLAIARWTDGARSDVAGTGSFAAMQGCACTPSKRQAATPHLGMVLHCSNSRKRNAAAVRDTCCACCSSTPRCASLSQMCHQCGAQVRTGWVGTLAVSPIM